MFFKNFTKSLQKLASYLFIVLPRGGALNTAIRVLPCFKLRTISYLPVSFIMQKVLCPVPRQLRGQSTEGFILLVPSMANLEYLKKNVKGRKIQLL